MVNGSNLVVGGTVNVFPSLNISTPIATSILSVWSLVGTVSSIRVGSL